MMFPESEYRVPFFKENGFTRKQCRSCGSYYWTQDPDRDNCGDAPCQDYTFIGNPPTSRSYTIEELREAFLSFFEDNGHARIRPYPVIARWRDDLFVTIASIADFQPFVTDGIIPPPSNPLVISQPCLRFLDIDNVGLTAGRHLTVFEMGGAHAFNYPEERVYWKDQTVRLHHRFATDLLGVRSELITYKEGVWSGGGNAGPDVEGCINGLEVSTLVFMQYKVVDTEFIDMPIKIVDTGYGIERFTWLSQGSPSGFHAIYGSLIDEIMRLAGTPSIDQRLLVESTRYSAIMNIESSSDRMALRERVARRLGMDSQELDRLMTPVESAYAVVDHTKALVLMLAEGVVPSNVKSGYLTRLLMRRTYRLLRLLKIEDQLLKIVDMQIKRWSSSFPNIRELRDEIHEALSAEVKKYETTLKRGMGLARRMANRIKSQGRNEFSPEMLAELYDSHGISPEIVEEAVRNENVRILIPDNFYASIAKRHMSPPVDRGETKVFEGLKEKVMGLPGTEELFYEDERTKVFDAIVLKVIDDRYIVLDRTAFYPEGGGQHADLGLLKVDKRNVNVLDVQRTGNVILHEVTGDPPEEGDDVRGEVDWPRRMAYMRHHTSTHILMGAVRRVLGEHAWQAGANKEAQRSRLDVSHWYRITPKQLEKIERMANTVVMKNLPVEVTWMPREKAEGTYGFRLYQGGVVPGRRIRVVKIGDWEVEACGGTHVKHTGEIGLIKIVHSERIQDGVERIVFSSGIPALKHVQSIETDLKKTSDTLDVPLANVVKAVEESVAMVKDSARKIRRLRDKLASYEVKDMLQHAKALKGLILVTYKATDADSEYLIKAASLLTERDPSTVSLMFSTNETVKIVVMAGEDAVRRGVNAGDIASELAQIVGGGGSGRLDFGQGGGVKLDKVSEAISLAEKIVERQISEMMD